MHAAGETDAARARALAAAARFPQSALAHCNAGFMLLLDGSYREALEAYERALRLQPEHAEARRGRAAALSYLGESAGEGDSLSVAPYTGAGRPIDLLLLVTLGRGNIGFDQLFDSSRVRITKLALELHGERPLPAHDVLFNAVGDAESSAEALAIAAGLATQTARPVLNRPERVLGTGRIEQSRRLRECGVRVASIAQVDRAGARAVPLPVLLRAPGYHAGEHFALARDDAEREEALRAMPEGALLALEFIDTRDAQGRYAKYRVVAIDGALYPVHLAFSSHWKVHYFSAQMAQSPDLREREAAFLADPEGTLGTRAWRALQRVADATGLDYAGIDFALDAAGEVVVFECNATMAVRYPPAEPAWAYRRPAVDAVRAAITRMLARYSST